ncbi:MAG: serine/threonine protein kinase [Verrucomicrobiales bacterium]|nr:serine/threonine protein kinase [Verrucomicrobiales bacterium]
MKRKPVFPTWILLLGLAVAVALAGIWGSQRVRATLERMVESELEMTLHANAQALEIWMTNQVRLAMSLADDPQLRSGLLAVSGAAVSIGPRWERNSGGPPGEDLGGRLRLKLENLGHDGMLVNTNLVVVAAVGRGSGRVGRTVMDSHHDKFVELFQTGRPVLIHPFRPAATAGPRSGRENTRGSTGRMGPFWNGGGPRGGAGGGPPDDLLLMQVAVPLRDENGVMLGALALVIDPEREFTRILSVSRLGQSGESYAFDTSGRMLSRSRFEPQLKALGRLPDRAGGSSVLNLRLSDPGEAGASGVPPEETMADRPLTRLVAAAVEGGQGVDAGASRDYRGIAVVGAWQWLEEFDFGLVVQQDAAEAYRPLRVLQWLFQFLVTLLVLASLGLLMFSHTHLVLRRRLNEAELKARELGQYRLEEKLGEGGMGVVYRARHALMRRPTAIKLLLPDRASPEAIRQFEREVQLTSELTHPNTIQIFDYGYTPEGIFYYVMEYLEGMSLKDLVARFGPVPEGRAIHLMSQVCEALHEAHQKGLVHRDVKPANVFVGRRGGIPDTVKVLDFGLVREYRSATGADTGEPGDCGPVGTPLFMSPESINCPSSIDPRSDIYSLGALGYHLVTGHHVFEDSTLDAVLCRQLSEPPRSPALRTANALTPEFERTLLSCLEKDPERRPQSVRELRALLMASPRNGDWDAAARAEWWAVCDAGAGRSLSCPTDAAGSDLEVTVSVGPATRRL